MREKIQDQFTDLPVSRQRKWQLRHREKNRLMKLRYYRESDEGAWKHRQIANRYYANHKECIKLKRHVCGEDRVYGQHLTKNKEVING